MGPATSDSGAFGLRGLTNLAEITSPIRLAQPPGTALINLAVATLIVTGLYFGREILVPVALAILFSFVLAPFASRLQSLRVPRTLSVLIAVFVGFSIIFSLGGLMVSQANRLAEELPGYQQTLRDKIQRRMTSVSMRESRLNAYSSC